MNIGETIRNLRIRAGLSQEELGSLCGTTKQTIFKYENGIITNIPLSRIERIAEILGSTPAYIMGWDEEGLPGNVLPMPRMTSIPLVGDIACGTPVLAEQNIEEYIDLPEHIKADFALRCHGDSMIGADIHDGDIVYIRQQPEVRSGQIAAVLIDDEATLKRVYINGKTVILQPENPAYSPLAYSGEDAAGLRILGLAVAFTHALI